MAITLTCRPEEMGYCHVYDAWIVHLKFVVEEFCPKPGDVGYHVFPVSFFTSDSPYYIMVVSVQECGARMVLVKIIRHTWRRQFCCYGGIAQLPTRCSWVRFIARVLYCFSFTPY